MCTSHQAHRDGLCQFFFFTLHFSAEHSEGTFPHARHQQPALAAALTSMVRNGVFPGVQDPFVGQALASLPDIAAVGSAFYTFYWPPRPPDVTFGRQGRQRGRMGFWCAFLTTSFHPQFMCFVFSEKRWRARVRQLTCRRFPPAPRPFLNFRRSNAKLTISHTTATTTAKSSNTSPKQSTYGSYVHVHMLLGTRPSPCHRQELQVTEKKIG